MIRFLKCALALCVALMCLFYAIQNVVNLQAAFSFVALMAGMEGHVAYPESFGFAVSSPALIWLILWIIILTEFAAGFCAAKGAWDMWAARSADAATFNSSKRLGILGAGLGVIIWFGYFHAVGGAFFQMWQIEAGGGPLNNAAQFATMCGIVMIYLSMQDE
jgi:predicted small integral membrane protein